MKKALLIMNPCSGKRKGAKYLADIIGILNAADVDVTVHMTAAPGDGIVVARQRAAEFDMVLCAGGDGTFNEVVSGLIQSGTHKPIGYLPCGSTNDFANSLGLPKELPEATRALLTAPETPYDIGSFGGRHFSYVASFGAFTRTSYATSQSVKNALGHLAYILGGIKELPSLHPYPVRMQTDSGEILEGDYLFGAISNSTSVGGILTLDPSVVDMNDGQFEILLVKSPGGMVELNSIIHAITSKKYTESKMITFCKARSVTVTASPDMDWTLDGEHEPGHEVVTVENLHSAVRVLVQPK